MYNPHAVISIKKTLSSSQAALSISKALRSMHLCMLARRKMIESRERKRKKDVALIKAKKLVILRGRLGKLSH